MHYNMQRSYVPGIGRYAQSDPIGLNGGINTYAYAGADPVSGVDPTGLVRIHGNWCGPDWTGGQREPFNYSSPPDHYLPPTDYTDASCMRHDKCFATCRELNPCDKKKRAVCMASCNSDLVSAQRFGSSSGTSLVTSLAIWLAIQLPPNPEEDAANCGCEK